MTNKQCYVFSKNKESCCGCSACVHSCPKHALVMVEDTEGFLFPKLSPENCINCGICNKVCPIINDIYANSTEHQECHIAVNANPLYSKRSATIGFCTMIAEQFVGHGRFVYGVVLDEHNWQANHICVTEKKDLDKIRNSKYIQSHLNNTFFEIKQLLLANEHVLFVGTPCQVAGLKAYLKNDFANLCTVDLICHGVYSYKLLQKEVAYWERKLNGRIKNFRFRSKERSPWNSGGIINFDIKDRKGRYRHIERHGSCSPVYRCFAYNGDQYYNLRESCYNCHFRSQGRYGDFTVGDAWGISGNYPEIFTHSNRKSGISLVFCNTKKANQYLSKLYDELILKTVPANNVFKQQALLPIKRQIPRERYLLYSNIDKEEWGNLVSKLLKVNFDHLYIQYSINMYKDKILYPVKSFVKTILRYFTT